ncbi:MAG TPA: NADH-ubiquinone oxidoreductase-F iron-sulfur binding region domain-containing protein [Dehalococcoidia bacterium]|nr:NADH-ubiquinone oxidoreductase-F iron-sulfur binding region domain-containing protein [Dehalococcoidia bacterium]
MAAYNELRQAADEADHAVTSPARTLARVGIATCSLASYADRTLEALRRAVEKSGIEVDVGVVGCAGICWAEPLVEVRRPDGRHILYGSVFEERVDDFVARVLASGSDDPELALGALNEIAVDGIPPMAADPWWGVQTRRLMARCGFIDPEDINQYIATDGYVAISKMLSSGVRRTDVIEEIKESGLWGRGGAAFSAGTKWDFLRTATNEPKYIAINADEGDPGAYVNRNIMESDPHLLIEGAMICAYATGATRAYCYIREEYPVPVERMQRATEQAYELGILGTEILDSQMSFDFQVIKGAGSYLCGEETGLIASIEGSRGMPKIRPPFPAQKGVLGQPTNVNNVETLINAPLIMLNGVEWFRSLGTEVSTGSKMFSLSGHVKRVGVLEVPFGTPVKTLLEDAAGGMSEGVELKGVQPGGPLGGILPAEGWELELDLPPFRDRGVLLGSGGLVVIGDNNCIVDLALYFSQFAEDESCGRCTTCFIGTQQLVEILTRIKQGRGRRSDVDKLKLLGTALQWSNCFHGQGAPTAVKNTLQYFEDEVYEHIDRRHCRAGVCKPLIRYEVTDRKADLQAAADICPTGAVVKNEDGWMISDERCIRCDACRQVAPEAIAVVDKF